MFPNAHASCFPCHLHPHPSSAPQSRRNSWSGGLREGLCWWNRQAEEMGAGRLKAGAGTAITGDLGAGRFAQFNQQKFSLRQRQGAAPFCISVWC